MRSGSKSTPDHTYRDAGAASVIEKGVRLRRSRSYSTSFGACTGSLLALRIRVEIEGLSWALELGVGGGVWMLELQTKQATKAA